MKSTFLRKCLCGGIATLLGPSLLMAITVKECPIRPATPESYKWNFPKETSGLFQEMMQRADDVKNDAEQLQILQSDVGEMGGMSWQGEAPLLEETVKDVNSMNEMLCRLRQIERVDRPWQQHAINRMAPKLVELASYTQASMDYLNSHHDYLFDPAYNTDINGIYLRAKQVRRIVRNSEGSALAGQAPAADHQTNLRGGG